MIQINLCNGSYLIWNGGDVLELRSKYRIVGSLIGALPEYPRQTTGSGLPLLLLPEEVYLLLTKFPENFQLVATSSSVAEFQQQFQCSKFRQFYQKLSQQYYDEVNERFKLDKRRQIETNLDRIVEGKLKKKQKLFEKELDREKFCEQIKLELLESIEDVPVDQLTTRFYIRSPWMAAVADEEENPITDSNSNTTNIKTEENPTIQENPKTEEKPTTDLIFNTTYLNSKIEENPIIQGYPTTDLISNASKLNLKTEENLTTEQKPTIQESPTTNLISNTSKLNPTIQEKPTTNLISNSNKLNPKTEEYPTIQEKPTTDSISKAANLNPKTQESPSAISFFNASRLNPKTEENPTTDLISNASNLNPKTEENPTTDLISNASRLNPKTEENPTTDLISNASNLNLKTEEYLTIQEKPTTDLISNATNLNPNKTEEYPTIQENSKIKLPTTFSNPTNLESLKFAVFEDFWNKGYYLTDGMKFGANFLAYDQDPIGFHAKFIIICLESKEEEYFDSNSILIQSYGRLGKNVRKNVLIATWGCDTGPEDNHHRILEYHHIRWNQIKI